jgi:hypothetical protein
MAIFEGVSSFVDECRLGTGLIPFFQFIMEWTIIVNSVLISSAKTESTSGMDRYIDFNCWRSRGISSTRKRISIKSKVMKEIFRFLVREQLQSYLMMT